MFHVKRPRSRRPLRRDQYGVWMLKRLCPYQGVPEVNDDGQSWGVSTPEDIAHSTMEGSAVLRRPRPAKRALVAGRVLTREQQMVRTSARPAAGKPAVVE